MQIEITDNSLKNGISQVLLLEMRALYNTCQETYPVRLSSGLDTEEEILACICARDDEGILAGYGVCLDDGDFTAYFYVERKYRRQGVFLQMLACMQKKLAPENPLLVYDGLDEVASAVAGKKYFTDAGSQFLYVAESCGQGQNSLRLAGENAYERADIPAGYRKKTFREKMVRQEVGSPDKQAFRLIVKVHHKIFFLGHKKEERAYLKYLLSDADAKAYLLRVNGKTVGMELLSYMEETVCLSSFGILPRYRRKGLAMVALGQLREEANAKGLKLSVQVDGRNEAAIKLYEKMGFCVKEHLGSCICKERLQGI